LTSSDLRLPSPHEIRRKRAELGMTQAELAKAAGISQGMVAKVESGKIDPRLSTLKRIVDVLSSAQYRVQRAEDIMTRPVISVKPSETIGRAISLMKKNGLSQLPVVESRVPVGIVTESSLLREVEGSSDPHDITRLHVSEVMDELPPILPPSADLRTVMPILEVNRVALVSDKGKLVGIITTSNILGSI